MDFASAPLVYSRPPAAMRMQLPVRLLATLVASGCAGVLCIAAWLTPNAAGVSTHTALHLARCQFLEHTGIPCLGCGMTTSFSWFVRGNILASLYVQPMGTVLAVLVAVTFWGAAYIAVTGKPVHQLVQRIPPRYYLWYLPAFAVAAWGWKIWIHLHGIDGWHHTAPAQLQDYLPAHGAIELIHNADQHP